MTRNRMAHRIVSYGAPKVSTLVRGRDDYNTWTWHAGIILAAMFVFMGVGAVVWGW